MSTGETTPPPVAPPLPSSDSSAATFSPLSVSTPPVLDTASASHVVRDLTCGRCNYNLRATPVDPETQVGRCPECGTRFSTAITDEQLIPWEQRKAMGRIETYLRTVRYASLQPARLSRAMELPISRSAAIRFRLVTIVLAYLSIMALTVPAVLDVARNARVSADRVEDRTNVDPLPLVFRDPTFLSISAVALLAFIVLSTGAPEYFFRRRSRDAATNARAGALSQYSCAPLALLPVLVVLVYGLAFVTSMMGGAAFEWPRHSDWLPYAWAPGVAMLLSSLFLMRFAAKVSWLRVLMAALLLPVVWGFTSVAVLVLPHAITTFVTLFLRRGA